MDNKIGVSEDEYESLRVIATRIARQYETILSSQETAIESATKTQEALQVLLPVLQSIADIKHEIMVPIPAVTVEAAKFMMPEMPAPVVQIMEGEKPSYRFTIERDGRGQITGGRIYPE